MFDIFKKKNNTTQFFFNFKLESLLDIDYNDSHILQKSAVFLNYKNLMDTSSVCYNTWSINLHKCNIGAYLFFFMIQNFFLKVKPRELYRNLFYFILVCASAYEKKKHTFYPLFKISKLRFLMHLFFSNSYFNKLFFEFNFYKFKRFDVFKKNLYYLYNFFLKSSIRKSTKDYSDFKMNEVYQDTANYLPLSANTFDLRSLIFGPSIAENTEGYIGFFMDEPKPRFRFLKQENVFKVIHNRRFGEPGKIKIQKYIRPHHANIKFLTLRYFFNSLLDIAFFESFEEFLEKKYNFFTSAFFNIDHFTEASEFFFGLIDVGIPVINDDVLTDQIRYSKFSARSHFDCESDYNIPPISTTYTADELINLPLDVYSEIDEATFVRDNKQYYYDLINEYPMYTELRDRDEPSSTFWDNAFFSFGGGSNFNYLTILNSFLLKRRKAKRPVSNIKRMKRDIKYNTHTSYNLDYLADWVAFTLYFRDDQFCFDFSCYNFICPNFTGLDFVNFDFFYMRLYVHLWSLITLIYVWDDFYLFKDDAALAKERAIKLRIDFKRARRYPPVCILKTPYSNRPGFSVNHNKHYIASLKKSVNSNSVIDNKWHFRTENYKVGFLSFYNSKKKKFKYRHFFWYKRLKSLRNKRWNAYYRHKKILPRYMLRGCTKISPSYGSGKAPFFTYGSFAAYKAPKYVFDKIKFVYHDNFKFSFYFLNFFRQFKFCALALILSRKYTVSNIVNFFKVSTSFNFFYFVNLAPTCAITLVTKKVLKFYIKKGNSYKLPRSRKLYRLPTNNYTPIFFFNDFIKVKFLRFFKSSNFCQYTHFYQYFLVQSLEHLFNCKVYVKVFSLLKIVIKIKKNKFIRFLKHKYRYYSSKIGKGFFLDETLEVLWITFFFKDPEFFLSWLAKTMKRLYFKKHRLFIYFLRIVLRRHFCKKFFKNLGFKGFLFDIRGKVGVTGNSKKRHIQFNWGFTSFSKKSLRLKYAHGLVHTNTGVMGVTFFIAH